MVRRLCELNYTLCSPAGRLPGRLPAMVTLTYPGDYRSAGRLDARHIRSCHIVPSRPVKGA